MEEKFSELRTEGISLTSVQKIIKRSGFTWQKVCTRGKLLEEEEIKDQRQAVSEKFLKLTIAKKKFIFIDEVWFSEKLLPKSAYSRPHPSPKKGLNVVCAISSEGLIGAQIFEGGLAGEDYACFLISLLAANPDIIGNLSNWRFFMDNCGIHKKKSISRFLKLLPIFYNAPYSPFLNPIENIFGICKYSFRFRQLRTPKDKIANILESFKSITPNAFKKTVRRAFKYMKKCFNREAIE